MELDWSARAQTLLDQTLNEIKIRLSTAGWNQVEDTNNITIHNLNVGDTLLAKSSGLINTTPDTLIRYFSDPNNIRHWIDNLKNAMLVQTNNDIRLVKYQVQNKWPVDDREFLFVSKTYNEGNLFYLIERSIDLPTIPVEAKHTRGEYIGGYVFEPAGGNMTKCTFVLNYDPSGNVPSAIKTVMLNKQVGRLRAAKVDFG